MVVHLPILFPGLAARINHLSQKALHLRTIEQFCFADFQTWNMVHFERLHITNCCQ